MGAIRANPAALTGLDTLALTRCRSRDRHAVVKDQGRPAGDRRGIRVTNVTGRNRVIEYKRTSAGRLTRVGSIRTRGRWRTPPSPNRRLATLPDDPVD